MNLKTAIIIASTIALQSVIGSYAADVESSLRKTARVVGQRLINKKGKHKTTKAGMKISKQNPSKDPDDDSANLVAEPTPVVAPTPDLPLKRYEQQHVITLFGVHDSEPLSEEESVFISDTLRNAMNVVHKNDDIVTLAVVVTKEELHDEHDTSKQQLNMSSCSSSSSSSSSSFVDDGSHHLVRRGDGTNGAIGENSHQRRLSSSNRYDIWVNMSFECRTCNQDKSTRLDTPTPAPTRLPVRIPIAKCDRCDPETSVRVPTKAPTKVPTRAPSATLTNIATGMNALETTFCAMVTASAFPRLNQTTSCSIS